jgi:hypothetical protein
MNTCAVWKVFVASASAYRQKPKAREKTDEQLARSQDTKISPRRQVMQTQSKSDMHNENIWKQVQELATQTYDIFFIYLYILHAVSSSFMFSSVLCSACSY